jgi:hypothetical protein
LLESSNNFFLRQFQAIDYLNQTNVTLINEKLFDWSNVWLIKQLWLYINFFVHDDPQIVYWAYSIQYRGGLWPKSLYGNMLYKSHGEIVKKPRITLKKPLFLNVSEEVFKKDWNLYKSPTFLNRSFHFFEKVFKNHQNLSKCTKSIK